MGIDRIKVRDLAFPRLASPDLGVAEQFLTDFGMILVERTADKLFMRGAGSAHHVHVTELGEPRFLGLAFYAQDEADLAVAACIEGASAVEPINEPGGGHRVRLREPNGYQIEIIHGVEEYPPIDVTQFPLNSARQPRNRVGDLTRLVSGSSPVLRAGHAVIATPRVAETLEWFRTTLGLLCSDSIYAGDADNLIGSFDRCDRGEEHVDHHTLAIFDFAGQTGLHHVSYEVSDMDAVLGHHHYLKSLGKYEHRWGVGRHRLGSQVFDYWADPWGRMHERWTDTDRIDARVPPAAVPVEVGLSSQWGDSLPERMGLVSP